MRSRPQNEGNLKKQLSQGAPERTTPKRHEKLKNETQKQQKMFFAEKTVFHKPKAQPGKLGTMHMRCTFSQICNISGSQLRGYRVAGGPRCPDLFKR